VYFSELSVNRRRNRPLRRRLKAQPSDSGRRRDSAKAWIKRVAPGALVALGAAVAIGLGVFCLFALRNTRSKNSEKTQIVSVTTPSPVGKAPNPALANLDTVHPGTIAAEDPNRSPLPTPVPTAVAPFPQPTAVVKDDGSRDLKPSEVERKSAERERRKAERKRSQLEAMYQKHVISSEAYKKGQDEYQSEMAKYRSALTGDDLTQRRQDAKE
jgi:type IV secretory pathway VirB10-like protein